LIKKIKTRTTTVKKRCCLVKILFTNFGKRETEPELFIVKK